MSEITEFRPIYTLTGASPTITDFPLEGGSTTGGTGQTFAPGQVVVMNADERIQEAADGEDTVLGTAAMAAFVGSTAEAQDTEIAVYLFDRYTVFEAAPTTPANVVSRADTGNSAAVWQDTHDFNRVADTAAGVHTIDENAVADDLFVSVDVDLTAGRVRLHIIGSSECQYLHGSTAPIGTPVDMVVVTADT